MLIKAPKGTKDILPADTAKWRRLEQDFAEVCRRFGFTEIRTPVFEYTELFARGIGDTSDVVGKQMYTFEDLGGRSVTLRPEGTAGIARAFIENKLYAGAQPTKLWYGISCFRYEKPQAGRLREFHQFGVEIFGSSDMTADAEVIGLADAFLGGLGLTGLELRVNSIGCPACRPTYREALKAFLAPRYDELCDTCKSRYDKNPLRILDCKSPVCGEIVKGAPMMMDYLCPECSDAFGALRADLAARGIAYEVDAGIVRGLDYYTKTAFEFVTDMIGAQGTVCGGGRYDGLIEELGGPDVPGVGFGLGIERLLLLLEKSGAPQPEAPGPDVFVVFVGEEAKLRAQSVVTELRAGGIAADMDTAARGVKGQFKYADRSRARYALTIGDEEIASGTARLKDMETGDEREAPLDGIVSFCRDNLNFGE
ncbi:MAG: histidine--tRNA ligase [Clostridiales Family XIII bacterium]|jgi:histidyl-tRNA synthetase|nr:histidine--tRNA ligase [Clostridiales Family XIII bacterium]